MTNFRRNTVAASVAAALTLGLVANAHAGAEAFAELTISAFTINNAAGGQFSSANFDFLNIGNSGGDSALLVSTGLPTSSNSVGATTGNVTPGAVCQGTGCPVGNNFTQQVAVTPPSPVVPDPTKNFARAAASLTGAIISGTPVGTPALANQVSEVALNKTDAGNAASNLGTGTTFQFNLVSASTMAFNALASGKTVVAQSAGSTGSSLAAFNFSISIRDLTTGALIYVFNPNALNVFSSLTIGVPGSVEYELASTAFSSFGGNVSPLLNATDTYLLTIASGTQVNASSTEVPEPASMMLLGVGLLGLVGGMRRRKEGLSLAV